MKNIRLMKTHDVIQRGIKALYRDLGPVEAQRFILMAGGESKDSVKRHREWQDAQDPEELLQKVGALHDAHRAAAKRKKAKTKM